MKNKPQVSLVIPLYNNATTLEKQLFKCEDILKKLTSKYEIIICEDKSTDETSKLLKQIFVNKKHFKILFHKKNQGIFKTIKELYECAKMPYIVLFSVDGDWEPNDIIKMVGAAQKYNADIVIGQRTYQNYSLYRKTISFCYNFLPILLFQIPTIDAGSIKVIKRELIHTIPLISTSVFAEAELIIRAHKLNKKIISTPIHFRKEMKKKDSGGKFLLVLQSIKDLILLRLKL